MLSSVMACPCTPCVLYALAAYFVFWILRRCLGLIPVSNLSSRVVLITGCDSGFGKLTTLKLGKTHNVKVLAGCLTDQGIADLEAENNDNIVAFKLDITKQESVDASLDFIESHCPNGLWALINNAGVLRGGCFEVASMADYELQMNVNCIGMARITKHMIPLLRTAKGRIINTSSIAGRFATAGTATYNASKFAVQGFSDALRRELSMWGIKVVIIEPGVMKTPLWDVPLSNESFNAVWNSLTKTQKEIYGKEFFDKGASQGRDLVKQLAGDPVLVVDTYCRAVSSRFPLARYAIGLDANFIFIPFSLLPTWMGDICANLLNVAPKPAALQ